jgi:hypothetical protein
MKQRVAWRRFLLALAVTCVAATVFDILLNGVVLRGHNGVFRNATRSRRLDRPAPWVRVRAMAWPGIRGGGLGDGIAGALALLLDSGHGATAVCQQHAARRNVRTTLRPNPRWRRHWQAVAGYDEAFQHSAQACPHGDRVTETGNSVFSSRFFQRGKSQRGRRLRAAGTSLPPGNSSYRVTARNRVVDHVHGMKHRQPPGGSHARTSNCDE